MNTNTNETCISYFARVYGIDFTETEGGMKDEELIADLKKEMRDLVQDDIDNLDTEKDRKEGY